MGTSGGADATALVMQGLAAGDRIGGPTAMASLLAESLGVCRGFDPEDVFRRYLAWWQAEGFDTGAVAARVFDLVLAGESRTAAVAHVHDELDGHTAGCNPAHRIAPLAASSYVTDEQLATIAMNEARLTHDAPLAGDVAAAVAILIRLLSRGVPWSEALQETAAGRMELTRDALIPNTDGNLSAGGYAPDVLRAAIHFLDRHPIFEEALEAAQKFAGPSNYCPVLVGAIGAVRYSLSSEIVLAELI